MKPGELRIGNWYLSVKFNQAVKCELTDLYELCVKSDGAYNDPPIEGMFEPIPLTEEWLLKYDHNALTSIQHEINVYGRFLFVWKPSYKYWYVVTIDSLEYLTKIEFVHEYQNFIFVLTGDEPNP